MASDIVDNVLREVFSIIDQDGSSTLEKKELLKALMFNEDIANKLHQFPHLLPLLKPKHFQESFELFGMGVRIIVKKSSSSNPYTRNRKKRIGFGLG